jgi:hypothetical protein
VLLHVTLGLVVITLAYQGLERLARWSPMAARAAVAVIGLAAIATFGWLTLA